MKKHKDLIYIVSVVLVAVLISGFAVGLQIGYVAPAASVPEPQQEPEAPAPPAPIPPQIATRPNSDIRDFPEYDSAPVYFTDAATGAKCEYVELNSVSRNLNIETGRRGLWLLDTDGVRFLYANGNSVYIYDKTTEQNTHLGDFGYWPAGCMFEGYTLIAYNAPPEDATVVRVNANGSVTELYKDVNFMVLGGGAPTNRRVGDRFVMQLDFKGTGGKVLEIDGAGNYTERTERKTYTYSNDGVYRVELTMHELGRENGIYEFGIFVNGVLAQSFTQDIGQGKYIGYYSICVFNEYYIVSKYDEKEGWTLEAFTYDGTQTSFPISTTFRWQNNAGMAAGISESGAICTFSRENGQYIYREYVASNNEIHLGGIIGFRGDDTLYGAREDGAIYRIRFL